MAKKTEDDKKTHCCYYSQLRWDVSPEALFKKHEINAQDPSYYLHRIFLDQYPQRFLECPLNSSASARSILLSLQKACSRQALRSDAALSRSIVRCALALAEKAAKEQMPENPLIQLALFEPFLLWQAYLLLIEQEKQDEKFNLKDILGKFVLIEGLAYDGLIREVFYGMVHSGLLFSKNSATETLMDMNVIRARLALSISSESSPERLAFDYAFLLNILSDHSDVCKERGFYRLCAHVKQAGYCLRPILKSGSLPKHQLVLLLLLSAHLGTTRGEVEAVLGNTKVFNSAIVQRYLILASSYGYLSGTNRQSNTIGEEDGGIEQQVIDHDKDLHSVLTFRLANALCKRQDSPSPQVSFLLGIQDGDWNAVMEAACTYYARDWSATYSKLPGLIVDLCTSDHVLSLMARSEGFPSALQDKLLPAMAARAFVPSEKVWEWMTKRFNRLLSLIQEEGQEYAKDDFRLTILTQTLHVLLVEGDPRCCVSRQSRLTWAAKALEALIHLSGIEQGHLQDSSCNLNKQLLGKLVGALVDLEHWDALDAWDRFNLVLQGAGCLPLAKSVISLHVNPWCEEQIQKITEQNEDRKDVVHQGQNADLSSLLQQQPFGQVVTWAVEGEWWEVLQEMHLACLDLFRERLVHAAFSSKQRTSKEQSALDDFLRIVIAKEVAEMPRTVFLGTHANKQTNRNMPSSNHSASAVVMEQQFVNNRHFLVQLAQGRLPEEGVLRILSLPWFLHPAVPVLLEEFAAAELNKNGEDSILALFNKDAKDPVLRTYLSGAIRKNLLKLHENTDGKPSVLLVEIEKWLADEKVSNGEKEEQEIDEEMSIARMYAAAHTATTVTNSASKAFQNDSFHRQYMWLPYIQGFLHYQNNKNFYHDDTLFKDQRVLFGASLANYWTFKNANLLPKEEEKAQKMSILIEQYKSTKSGGEDGLLIKQIGWLLGQEQPTPTSCMQEPRETRHLHYLLRKYDASDDDDFLLNPKRALLQEERVPQALRLEALMELAGRLEWNPATLTLSDQSVAKRLLQEDGCPLRKALLGLTQSFDSTTKISLLAALLLLSAQRTLQQQTSKDKVSGAREKEDGDPHFSGRFEGLFLGALLSKGNARMAVRVLDHKSLACKLPRGIEELLCKNFDEDSSAIPLSYVLMHVRRDTPLLKQRIQEGVDSIDDPKGRRLFLDFVERAMEARPDLDLSFLPKNGEFFVADGSFPVKLIKPFGMNASFSQKYFLPTPQTLEQLDEQQRHAIFPQENSLRQSCLEGDWEVLAQVLIPDKHKNTATNNCTDAIVAYFYRVDGLKDFLKAVIKAADKARLTNGVVPEWNDTLNVLLHKYFAKELQIGEDFCERHAVLTDLMRRLEPELWESVSKRFVLLQNAQQ